MEYRAVNLAEKFSKFSQTWSPRIIARFNDYHLKIAKVQGEFIWHEHAETDEVFIVLKGSLEIFFRDGRVSLEAGQVYVVPRGVEHRPAAAQECQILLIEPAGTMNTGGAGGERTAPADVWI